MASANLTAKDTEYATTQGDMWDIVALREYGDEHAMHYIQDANFYQRFTDIFPANVTLELVPEVTVQINLKMRATLPDLKQLLPWR
jgi:hypothetical protein